MKRIIFSLLSLLLVSTTALALESEDNATLIVKGNEAYQQGDYESASKYYLRAIKNNAGNGHIYYNLGNAYFRQGFYGRAIASYRRAKIQLPRDPDVIANLQLARDEDVDSIVRSI